MLKRISVGLLAIIVYAICLEIGERVEIPGVHSYVSTAEAIIAPRASTTVRPQRPLERLRQQANTGPPPKPLDRMASTISCDLSPEVQAR